MEQGLVRLVDSLLDAMQVRAERGETIDLIESFAGAIPVEIIGNLLGVPHDERAPLRGWSLAILGALEPVLSARTRHSAATRRCATCWPTSKGWSNARRVAPGDPRPMC